MIKLSKIMSLSHIVHVFLKSTVKSNDSPSVQNYYRAEDEFDYSWKTMRNVRMINARCTQWLFLFHFGLFFCMLTKVQRWKKTRVHTRLHRALLRYPPVNTLTCERSKCCFDADSTEILWHTNTHSCHRRAPSWAWGKCVHNSILVNTIVESRDTVYLLSLVSTSNRGQVLTRLLWNVPCLTLVAWLFKSSQNEKPNGKCVVQSVIHTPFLPSFLPPEQSPPLSYTWTQSQSSVCKYAVVYQFTEYVNLLIGRTDSTLLTPTSAVKVRSVYWVLFVLCPLNEIF